MPRTTDFTVISNDNIATGVYKMTLKGDTSEIKRPGQFVNIALDSLFLRRPISVCDVEGDVLTIIYKVVGEGTRKMSELPKSSVLNILTGLGNGYDLDASGARPILIGGGVGVPPLYLLAKRLVAQGKAVEVVIGFNRADEAFYEEEFKALGCNTHVFTADGSYGNKGFVTDFTGDGHTHFYACGPLAMLKAVCGKYDCGGEVSMEERMGCGFGACMGCTLNTKNGFKRVCKEGPVFDAEEIIW